MEYFEKRAAMRRLSRRALLEGLAGSIVGLRMISTKPGVALAQSARLRTSATYTRGQTLYSYKGMSLFTQAIDWSPAGNRIVSAGADLQDTGEVARIWDALTGNHVLTYTGDGGFNGYGVSTAEWAPDGSRIASAVGRLGKIWNPATGQTLTTYTGHAPTVEWLPAVEWAPDGQRVASSGGAVPKQDLDHSIHIWDPATGAHLLSYNGHTLDANALSWSPDGRSIASGNGALIPTRILRSMSGIHILVNFPSCTLAIAVQFSPLAGLLTGDELPQRA